MSGPDEIITGALHDMAGQAAPPRLRIDAAWRTGRRRRLATIVTSTAGAAAIAIAVPLAVTGGLSGPSGVKLPGSGPISGALPGRALPQPIELRPVTAASSPPCRDSFAYPPGGTPYTCLHLASTGLTVTRIASAHVIQVSHQYYALRVSLLSSQDRDLQNLTANVAHQAGVRRQLAVEVHGVVYFAPEVTQALRGGTFQIVVRTAAQFDYLKHDLGVRGPEIPQTCHTSLTNGVAVTQCR